MKILPLAVAAISVSVSHSHASVHSNHRRGVVGRPFGTVGGGRGVFGVRGGGESEEQRTTEIETKTKTKTDTKTETQTESNKEEEDNPKTPIEKMVKCTDTPQWLALQAAASTMMYDDKLHLRNLCSDAVRCSGLVARHESRPQTSNTASGGGGVGGGGNGGGGSNSFAPRRMILDYSRQRVTEEIVELLFDLADKVRLVDKRNDMRCGAPINTTEGRPVLHHVLRMPRGYDYARYSSRGGKVVLDAVHAVRDRIQEYVHAVRSGRIKGVTGKPFVNYVCVGIGGSQLGPEFVAEALKADPDASLASGAHPNSQNPKRTLRFLGNADPVAFAMCTRDLNPEETLVIVVSKTFSTVETMLNARTCRKWLVDALSKPPSLHHDAAAAAGKEVPTPQQIIARHMAAVTTHTTRALEFGISETNLFQFWDWVGGRYSVCSAAGLLPLSLQYSFPILSEFLQGAHDVDEHFFSAPLRENIPVILGLLGVWNATFMEYGTRAILPYSQALHRFPAHVQQLDMESNGKRVAMDGTPLPFPAGEVTFGEPGTNGQHSFYQLLHQGRVVPADFIGFMESPTPVEVRGEFVSNHDELMSHFFAQPDALAYGRTMTDLIQEGVPEELREHKIFMGNRPSSTLLLSRLDAFGCGQLLALYEHRTAVQGFVWGINSFDQFGVELGKVLAKQVRAQLNASRKSGASVQGFNTSTSSLLEAYLSNRRGGGGGMGNPLPPTV